MTATPSRPSGRAGTRRRGRGVGRAGGVATGGRRHGLVSFRGDEWVRRGREAPGRRWRRRRQHQAGEGGGEPAGVGARGQPGAEDSADGGRRGEQQDEAPVGWTPKPARTASAAALVMVMTTSEVPAAYSIGSASASTSAGTTRKPPPTPRKPVSRPTTVAVTSTFSARGHWQAKVGLNVMIGSSSVARRVRLPAAGAAAPRALAHDHHARRRPASGPRTPPAAPARRRAPRPWRPRPRRRPRPAPKATPRPSSTLPARYAVTAPSSEVTPTTTSDPVVAWAGLWPSG